MRLSCSLKILSLAAATLSVPAVVRATSSLLAARSLLRAAKVFRSSSITFRESLFLASSCFSNCSCCVRAFLGCLRVSPAFPFFSPHLFYLRSCVLTLFALGDKLLLQPFIPLRSLQPSLMTLSANNWGGSSSKSTYQHIIPGVSLLSHALQLFKLAFCVDPIGYPRFIIFRAHIPMGQTHRQMHSCCELEGCNSCREDKFGQLRI